MHQELRTASLALALAAVFLVNGAAHAADAPPVANFTSAVSGLTVKFTDTSSDTNGTIGSHQWRFGDGKTSTAVNPSHTYAAAGTYGVTESVTDNVGLTASKTSAVTVSGSTGGEPQFLLNNTGFETTGAWTGSSGVLCKVGATGCSGESAHAGTGFAWLGGFGGTHSDTLSQQTNMALLSGKLTLQFWLHVDTAETSTSAAYDKLTVGIYSPTGTLLKAVATFSNLNKAAGYQLHSYDMTPWVGQKVTLRFTSTEDATAQTSFVLDDVTLIDYAQ